MLEAYAQRLQYLLGEHEQTHADLLNDQTEQTIRSISEQTARTEQTERTPLDSLERWRRIYLSDKLKDMSMWPNLAGIGLTEAMLLEGINIREEKGVPALLFDEDMEILNHNFGQPEWVKIKIKSSPLRYLRACIAQGGVTPAEGYESPVQARIKAVRASREAHAQDLKALEVEEMLLWWLELPGDIRMAYTEKFKHAPEDTRKRLSWNEWRKNR